MKLKRFNQADEFGQRTRAYLQHHEAEHNLLLGIQNTLIRYSQPSHLQPYLAIVEVGANIVAVALCTPPSNLLLSKAADPAALMLIAQDLQGGKWPVVGVSGLVSEAQHFATVWQNLTQQSYQLKMHLFIHQLEQIQAVSMAPGSLRVARWQDRNLVCQWSQAFDLEALGSIHPQTEQIIERQLHRGRLYLWQNPYPVSMAAGRVSPLGGGRIGPVYTPPLHRCQGYATACVATLSQILLDQGCQSCYLFTDQANPTANHIYEAIGYEVVCDWHEYSFAP